MKEDHLKQKPKGIPTSIGKPALRALESANIVRMDQLTSISQEELLKLHGIGPKAIRILRETLAVMGLDFAASDESIDISTEANKKIQRRY